MANATEPTDHSLRDIVIGTLVLVVAGAIGVFANIPTRVSVIESDNSNIKDSVKSIDNKLDVVLARLSR